MYVVLILDIVPSVWQSPKRDAIGILETAFIVSDNKLNVVHCYWRELCMYSIDKVWLQIP